MSGKNPSFKVTSRHVKADPPRSAGTVSLLAKTVKSEPAAGRPHARD
jgi:hypothetical protein